ncbi:hypothetical protein [Streptomyces sp. NPDC004042]|uniref:hypothetical protein n=1 Tax=Streptomyces sp. NPDC004042 TaxID=3154451 RepID=UPI0033A304EA
MRDQEDPERELNAYERILAEDRRVVREMFRVTMGGAHVGLGLLVLAVLLSAGVGGVRWALSAGGAVVAWFAVTLVVVVRRGRRGRDAVARAYLLTFGWAGWL